MFRGFMETNSIVRRFPLRVPKSQPCGNIRRRSPLAAGPIVLELELGYRFCYSGYHRFHRVALCHAVGTQVASHAVHHISCKTRLVYSTVLYRRSCAVCFINKMSLPRYTRKIVLLHKTVWQPKHLLGFVILFTSLD